MRFPGTGEVLLILLLCVVVFAGSKLNAIGDLVGSFMKNLRRGMSEDERIQVRRADDEPRAPDDRG